MRNDSRRLGFTLIELLVVIAIIGVLVALLLPAVQAAREAARRSQCSNNLKQMGIALQTHHDAKKQYPTGRDGYDTYAVSWAFFLLPYLEESSVYQSRVPTAPVSDAQNSLAMRTPIGGYACPSRREAASDRNFDNNDAPPTVLHAATLGDYAANAGRRYDTSLSYASPGGTPIFGGYDRATAGPIFSGSHIAARQVTDGLSHSIAIGERHLPPAPLTAQPTMEDYFRDDTAFLAGDMPMAIFSGVYADQDSSSGLATGPDDPNRGKFGSLHTGISQFAFLDGHVSAISLNIPVNELLALCTIGGNETTNPSY